MEVLLDVVQLDIAVKGTDPVDERRGDDRSRKRNLGLAS